MSHGQEPRTAEERLAAAERRALAALAEMAEQRKRAEAAEWALGVAAQQAREMVVAERARCLAIVDQFAKGRARTWGPIARAIEAGTPAGDAWRHAGETGRRDRTPEGSK